MRIFNSIKKSRRASSDIDEKIEYLNKELEKTGLREGMTTTNIYTSGKQVDNEIYNSFTSSVFNANPLGFSPSDNTQGLGGAYTGKMVPSEVGLTPGYHDSILNTKGAALSPPHPVSGKRRYASTRLGGMIGQQYFPTRPGVVQGNRTLPTGSVAWLWNPNINNTDDTTGNWYPLEFEPHSGQWGFWDTNFMGFGYLNTNLSQLEFTSGDNTGATVLSLFNSIGIRQKGVIGTPQTIVLQKNDLGDAGFLPINVGLSKQGYDYLKRRSRGSRGRRGSGFINYRQQKQKLDQPPTKSRAEIRGDKVKQLRSEGDNISANKFYTQDRIKELEGKKTLTYREESELKGLQEYNDLISSFDTPENNVSVADRQKTFDTQAVEENQSFNNQFQNNSNEIASEIATYVEKTTNLSAEEKKAFTEIANDIRSGENINDVISNNLLSSSSSTPQTTPEPPSGGATNVNKGAHEFPDGTTGSQTSYTDQNGDTQRLYYNDKGESVDASGRNAKEAMKLADTGKDGNNAAVGLGVVTGSVAKHTPSAEEISQYIANITPEMIASGEIQVNSERVPYTDGNFQITYDSNGKRVFTSNRDADGNQGANFPDMSFDSNNSSSMTNYGKPIQQVVYPSDGSEPYLLFEKYSYHNKQSTDNSEIPDPWSQFGSDAAHFLGKVFEPINELLFRGAFGAGNKVPQHVKDMGIHGMAHTEQKIPLSELSEDFREALEQTNEYNEWNNANNDKNAVEKYPPPGQTGESTTPDGRKVRYYNKGLQTSADGSKYFEVLVMPWVEPEGGGTGYYGGLHSPSSYYTKVPLGGAQTRLRGMGKEVYTPKPKPKPQGGYGGGQGNPTNRRGSGARSEDTLYQSKGKLLSEAAKLGHFEPEILNVDINDLRKGIMPEFPKDPPPKMVDGYSEKSKLAPKKEEGDPDPFIKITKKDLAKNHMLKDSEIKKFMDEIDSINKYIKENPSELIYAQQRYPKDDPRLAQLNWQMDQMLDAGKEYMDKTFPENEKLFKKIQKTIKKNIELTDPKSFKGVEVPKFEGVNLTDYKRRKEVVARHYKKAVKIQKLFSNKKRRKNIKEEVECKKINIQEIMTTSNMYFSGEKVPNQDYSDFEGTSEGGYGLGLSGADGNNIGGAVIQTGEGSIAGVKGVAYSPPHPVTGVRTYATHVSTGLGDRVPLRPGVTIGRGFSDNPPQYTMGSVLWFFDPTYNFGGQQGQWCYFEWSNFENNTGWGFWDTIKTGQFAGVYTFNRNLSQHPCAGDDIAGKVAGLNFSLNGAVGAPQTTVLFKKDLGDPDLLPINIPGLSPEAFNYLFAGANYDLYNWILKTYGMPAAEWYLKTGKTQGNPFAPYGSYFPRASNPYTDAQDGDMFAFFGGNKNNNKKPEVPTKKTRAGATDATAASTGMYPNMTPEIFQQKYGMTWQEYMNLP